MADEEKRPHLVVDAKTKQTRTYEGRGGGGTYPRTSYEQHARQVFAEAQRLVAAVDQRKGQNPTSRNYFRVQAPEDVAFWTVAGENIADALHASIVAAPAKNVAHVSTTRSGLDLLVEQLERYADSGTGKSKFATIDELGEIPLSEKIATSLASALKEDDREVSALLSLFRDLSAAECNAVAVAIGEQLRAEGGEVEARTAVESGYYVRVRAKARTVKRVAESFITVQSVDRVDSAEIELSAVEGEPLISSMEVVPTKTDALVGIFDAGVSRSRFFDDAVVAREEPLGQPFNVAHGNFVASRIIYGDTLVEQYTANRFVPDVRVLSVCIFPVDGSGNRRKVTTEQLMTVIRETVARWAKQVRVFNLSMNLFPPDLTVCEAADPDTVGPLAAELDHLARKHRVLFVVSCGNYPRPGGLPPTKKYPDYFSDVETRIVPPAEAVLALTVGSVSEKFVNGAIAPKDAPSPFTRRGPGFANFRKPDVVAHGGNVGGSWHHVDDLATVGIGVDGDRLARGHGTSFAAPLVSRMAGQLFASIPNATPELVRALIIHYAEPLQDGAAHPHVGDLLGNGRPDATRLLSSSRWSQAFVHTGELPYREIRRIPFYVPKALATRARRNCVRVRATVAYTPETNRALKAGYCMSNIALKVAKLNGSGQLVDTGTADGPEVVRDRYASVVRFTRTFSSGIAGGSWELVLEHQSRWAKRDPVPFAAVVTVEDPRQDASVDILQAIRNEVPNEYKVELQSRFALRV